MLSFLNIGSYNMNTLMTGLRAVALGVSLIALAAPADVRGTEVRPHAGGPLRSPHAIRVEIPDALTRVRHRDDDRD